MISDIVTSAAATATALWIYECGRHYLRAARAGVNIFRAKPKKVITLGEAVSEWYNENCGIIPRMGEYFSSWREKLPEDMKTAFHEKLNYSNLDERVEELLKKRPIKIENEYEDEGAALAKFFIRRRFYDKPACKQMISSFYREPAVAQYLTS